MTIGASTRLTDFVAVSYHLSLPRVALQALSALPSWSSFSRTTILAFAFLFQFQFKATANHLVSLDFGEFFDNPKTSACRLVGSDLAGIRYHCVRAAGWRLLLSSS